MNGVGEYICVCLCLCACCCVYSMLVSAGVCVSSVYVGLYKSVMSSARRIQ